MKKLLFIIGLSIPIALFGQGVVESALDTLDFGTVADDGTGETLREGAIGLNANDVLFAQYIDTLLTDTISLDSTYSWTFVIGQGLSGDTVFAEDDALIGSIAHLYGDSIQIYAINGVLKGSSPTLDVEIGWHSTLESGSATLLNATPFTITSTTTGDTYTSFNNSVINRGERLYIKVDDATVGSKPTYFEMTIYYKLL